MKCQVTRKDYYSDNVYTWCTNCGNYGIHGALKDALIESCIKPKDLVLCFDIGCNGNGADKINANIVHGIHGRVIPLASGISMANRKIKVIAFGGDGGTLAEGINHLISAVRYDFNFTFILHNNFNFALTKGQNSPVTNNDNTIFDPVDPMKLVFSLNPSFVARGISADTTQLKYIFRSAIEHRGFSFVEVWQDCPTYNTSTTHKEILNRYYDVSKELNYRTFDLETAKRSAFDKERIATGVIYQKERKPIFDKYERWKNRSDLVDETQEYNIEKIINDFR